jgi:SdpI/YhfL family protein
MSVFEKGLSTILACSLLGVLLGIPLMLRRIPRNVVYGFRTRSTLSDDRVWYEANAHFGRRLIAASAATGIAIVVLYRAGLAPAIFLKLSVAALAVPLFLAILATSRFVRSLTVSGRDRSERR